ncbi:MAG: hypothetical protein J7L94_04590 [Caldisericaceae bacterium]|nr:hypothetical protein [Caldisericaceae bacterium]
MIWYYFADIETADSLLNFTFQAFSDSLILQFNQKNGWLKLTAQKYFQGNGWLWIQVSNDSAATVSDSIMINEKTMTALANGSQSNLPRHFYSTQNFHNPFNPITYFELGLPQSQIIGLTLFDLRGRAIHRWRMGKLVVGRHHLKIDANQLQLASVIYFLHLKSQHFQAVRKMVLLK